MSKGQDPEYIKNAYNLLKNVQKHDKVIHKKKYK